MNELNIIRIVFSFTKKRLQLTLTIYLIFSFYLLNLIEICINEFKKSKWLITRGHSQKTNNIFFYSFWKLSNINHYFNLQPFELIVYKNNDKVIRNSTKFIVMWININVQVLWASSFIFCVEYCSISVRYLVIIDYVQKVNKCKIYWKRSNVHPFIYSN